MSHHPERTARNVRPVNQPPSFDKYLQKTVTMPKRVPVLISYSIGGRDDGVGGVVSSAFVGGVFEVSAHGYTRADGT